MIDDYRAASRYKAHSCPISDRPTASDHDYPARRAPTEPTEPGRVGPDKHIIEMKDVDVYDLTTGQIRNSSTDDIACWFIVKVINHYGDEVLKVFDV